MRNRKILLGLLAMVLVLGTTILGCKEAEGKVIIGNNSANYTITRISLWGDDGTDINEKNLSIKKGQSKTWSVPAGYYKFTVEVEHTGTSDLPEFNSQTLSNHSISIYEGDTNTQILHVRTGKNSDSEDVRIFTWLERYDNDNFNY